MSAFLKKLVNTPPVAPTVKEVTLLDPETHEEGIVCLQSNTDAENLFDTMMQDPSTIDGLCRTYESLLATNYQLPNVKVSAQLITMVKLVLGCLVQDEEPITELDLVYLAKTQGINFFKLVEAASTVNNVEELGKEFMEAEAGNSSGVATPSRSVSISGPSKRPRKPRASSGAKGTQPKR